MKGRTALSALVSLVMALAAVFWSANDIALAESSGPAQMAVIIADGAAVYQADQGSDLTRSLVGLVAALQEGRPLTFITVGDPSEKVGPFEANDPDFRSTLDAIGERLKSPSPVKGGGYPEALAEAFSMLSIKKAAPGSDVYVISGTSPKADAYGLPEQLVPTVTQFQNKGWVINGVSLRGASRESLGLLQGLSGISGGSVFELSVSDGFQEMSDAILHKTSNGSLAPLGQRVLGPGDLLTSVVSVPPGTGQTTLLFFKESPWGSLFLSNPLGFQASPGDRTKSYVIETPNVVVWKIIDPVPGEWKFDARWMEGLISVWQYTSNKYVPVLKSTASVPLGQPAPLVAYVKDGDRIAPLEGVRMFIEITTPEGVGMLQEMKDDGLDVDAKAGDGYFTTVLSPLRNQGQHRVQLELSWPDLDHTISSETSLEVRAFPAIEIIDARLDGLPLDERTMVAKVFVHVLGEPYPISPEQLTIAQSSASGQAGVVELVPKRLFGEGPAWEYDLFLTPREHGPYTMLPRLDIEYAGRRYSHAPGSIVAATEPPPAAVVAPVMVEAPAATQIEQTPAAAPAPQLAMTGGGQAQQREVPWLLVAVPALLLISIVAAAVYLLTRTKPYGYLYSNDEPLVDFAKVKRNPVLGFLFRGTVSGGELKVPGLEEVVFYFSGNRIKLRSFGKQPSVRVDNEPLTGEAAVQDRTWIGTGGKLYTYVLSPSPEPGAAGAG